MSNIINDHRTQDGWKIQLTIALKFFETRKVIKQIRSLKNFLILFYREKKKKKKESIKSSKFVFDRVDLSYYKLHKISLNHGGLYTDSPKWLKNKKATKNPKNNDDKCFHYAATVSLDHEQIKKVLHKFSIK